MNELRELDKKIADLKGIRLRNDILPPLYSSRIQTAWELFEEMHTASSIHKNGAGYYTVYVGLSDNMISHAQSAPEAIARAWIKWKENDRA